MGQIQALRRADGAAGGAVAGFECGFDVIGVPLGGTDTFEGAYDGADLVVQERTGAQGEMVRCAVGVGVLGDGDLIKCFDGGCGLAEG